LNSHFELFVPIIMYYSFRSYQDDSRREDSLIQKYPIEMCQDEGLMVDSMISIEMIVNDRSKYFQPKLEK